MIPRIPYPTILAIRKMHMDLFHVASVQEIVEGINSCAWLNVQVLAKDVITVLNKYPCLSCSIAKVNRLTTPNGSGVKPWRFGQWVAMDFVLVKRPATSSQGHIGWFHFTECSVGYEIPILTKSKNVSNFIRAVELVRQELSKYNHRLEYIRCDAATVENSEEAHQWLADNHIAIKPAIPRNQRQNPAERSLQTVFNNVSAMLSDQKLLGPAFYDLAVVAQCMARNIVRIYNGVSLYFHMTGIMPDINDFKFPFGTPVVTFEQLNSDAKFKPKGQFGITVGGTYNGNHGILVYIPGRGMKPFVRYNVKDLKMITRPVPIMEIQEVIQNNEFDEAENEAVFTSHTKDKTDAEYAAIKPQHYIHTDADSTIPSQTDTKNAIHKYNTNLESFEFPTTTECDNNQQIEVNIAMLQLDKLPINTTNDDSLINVAIQQNRDYYDKLTVYLSNQTVNYEDDIEYFDNIAKIMSDGYMSNECYRYINLLEYGCNVCQTMEEDIDIYIFKDYEENYDVNVAKKKCRNENNPTLHTAMKTEESWFRWEPIAKKEMDQLCE